MDDIIVNLLVFHYDNFIVTNTVLSLCLLEMISYYMNDFALCVVVKQLPLNHE